jgi:ABC-type uncharacterized transport system YnjBCD substrate-binding protein
MAALLPDDATELTKLHGRDSQYEQLVSNCFAADEDGAAITWGDAKVLTMQEFLASYATDQPKRKNRLKSWIAHYGLEDGFKQPQPNGKLTVALLSSYW